MTERRRTHFFHTYNYRFDIVQEEHEAWLNSLPGKLLAEGPYWANAGVRMAITVEDEPVEQHVHMSGPQTDWKAQTYDWKAQTYDNRR